MAASDLWAHFRQSYFMADRLPEYRCLLLGIQERGYRFLPMAEFATAIRGGASPEGPVALLRVDVDSDPRGAGLMFDVERHFGIRATYYFRLSTIERSLIAEMQRHGTEVGYHFEEGSTLARSRGFREGSEIIRARHELRDKFRCNLARFRDLSGVIPRTVAAHGDFLNRRLGVSNNCFVDRALLDETGILAEAYERWLGKHISARIADRPPPLHWQPRSPQEALGTRPKVLSIIVHPRQWVRSPWANARADVERAYVEAEYRLKRLVR